MLIRPARAADLPLLVEIEISAGSLFRAIGMPEIADDDPGSVAELAHYADDGRALVTVDGSDRPLGYLLLEPVDGAAHVEQLSVASEHAGHGYGRQLLDRARSWAGDQGLTALTLTTFRDVPWNGPYYRRLGFRDVPPVELTPGLQRIRAAETDRGLDRWPRIVMRRDLATSG